MATVKVKTVAFDFSYGSHSLSFPPEKSIPTEVTVTLLDQDNGNLSAGKVAFRSYPEEDDMFTFRFVCSHRINSLIKAEVWCDHIEALVREGRDSEFLMNHRSNLQVALPWMPSLDIWLTILISEEVVAGGKAVSFLRPTTSNFIHLGYLNPGEGLGTVRLLLQEKIEEERFTAIAANVPVLSCKSPTHDYTAQRQVDLAKSKGGRKYWAQAWSIYGEGACLRCLEFQKESADVPEI